MATTDNPFLQADLPNAQDWTNEKQHWWEITRALGRWRYGLYRIRARFSGARLLGVVAVLFAVLLLPFLAQLPERGLALFNWEMVQVLLRVARWYVPVIIVLFVAVGFLEGWMRWDLYESFAAAYAGPPYTLNAFAAPGEWPVALLTSRRPKGPPDVLVAFDGQTWRMLYTNDQEQHLIDVVVLPDQTMLIFRLGGDLFQIEPSGAVRLHPTGMEGGYIVAVEPNRYLITGAPFSLWFNSANGSFERVEVRGAVRPALHAESVYLFDSTDQHVTILNKGQITTLPVKDDAWISGLAVTADGTLFLAERIGSDKDRGRVLRHAEGNWVPLRAPFAGPVIDLSADDAQLLAITPQGVFRYDLPSDTWTREEIADPGWLFVRQSQQLCIFNTLTGAVLARRDGTWRPERFVVPLGADPVDAVKGY